MVSFHGIRNRVMTEQYYNPVIVIYAKYGSPSALQSLYYFEQAHVANLIYLGEYHMSISFVFFFIRTSNAIECITQL